MQSSVIIDVRSAQEYASGHLAGAVHIPYDEIEQRIGALAGVGKSTPIVVYCASGARSGIAASVLGRQGYTQVVNGGSMALLLMQIKGTITSALI